MITSRFIGIDLSLFFFFFYVHVTSIPPADKGKMINTWYIFLFLIEKIRDPGNHCGAKRLSQLIPSWQTVFLVFLSNESLPFEIVESPTEFSFWVFQFLFRRLPQKTCFFFFQYCVQHFQWIRLVFLDFVNDIPTHTQRNKGKAK